MSKEKYVTVPRAVRTDPEVHECLNKLAAKDRRSVANLIGVIILEYVEKHKREVR